LEVFFIFIRDFAFSVFWDAILTVLDLRDFGFQFFRILDFRNFGFSVFLEFGILSVLEFRNFAHSFLEFEIFAFRVL